MNRGIRIFSICMTLLVFATAILQAFAQAPAQPAGVPAATAVSAPRAVAPANLKQPQRSVPRFWHTNMQMHNLMQMLTQSEDVKANPALQGDLKALIERAAAGNGMLVSPQSAQSRTAPTAAAIAPVPTAAPSPAARPTSADFLIAIQESTRILEGALKVMANCTGIKDNPDLAAKTAKMISDAEKMAVKFDALAKQPEAAQPPAPLYLNEEEIKIRTTMVEMAEMLKKCKGLEKDAANIDFLAKTLHRQIDTEVVQAEAYKMRMAGRSEEVVRAYTRERIAKINQQYGNMMPPMPMAKSPAEAQAINRERGRMNSMVQQERLRLMNEIQTKRQTQLQQGPPPAATPTPAGSN